MTNYEITIQIEVGGKRPEKVVQDITQAVVLEADEVNAGVTALGWQVVEGDSGLATQGLQVGDKI